MSRVDQYNVTVTIGNSATGNLGTFDKLSGGEVDSEESKYRPGNMGAEISLGGYKSVGNITLSRLFQLGRDTNAVQAFLIAQTGKGGVKVVKQPLDVDGVAFGQALVYTGVLKRVMFPEHDSESADPGMVEIEVSSATLVSI